MPEIIKWKTDKLINMSNMFNGCSSLLIFPDISKWKMNDKKISIISDNYPLSSTSSSLFVNVKTSSLNTDDDNNYKTYYSY